MGVALNECVESICKCLQEQANLQESHAAPAPAPAPAPVAPAPAPAPAPVAPAPPPSSAAALVAAMCISTR
ncbi:hypothetical protein EBS02_07350 [bacterium]|nr:hypothetical protein [bacterium]